MCPSPWQKAEVDYDDQVPSVNLSYNSTRVHETKEYVYEEEEEDVDFEFVSFQKSADEVFFGDHTRMDSFPLQFARRASRPEKEIRVWFLLGLLDYDSIQKKKEILIKALHQY
ncbi:uncharacterized protein LOC133728706 [Rosa rugosa]|uniref:uncharacterized protein LOC133728706 n=1 Tax=Rosa rugosa TaxID=74645 RepID=UPI002B409E18|nr:uncharacterized protein LOC133728706 [Rosa rugosa]